MEQEGKRPRASYGLTNFLGHTQQSRPAPSWERAGELSFRGGLATMHIVDPRITHQSTGGVAMTTALVETPVLGSGGYGV